MSGLSDYAAQALLNWETGLAAMPAVTNRYLALFTTAPTADAGTGGTEVTGGAYARVQIAGQGTTNASTSTSSATLSFASTPAWIVPGMSVKDVTSPTAITGGQTVLSVTGTTVVMSANANASVGSGDTLQFSMWPASSASSGSEPATVPATVTNGGVITFPAATANWGTVVAYGVYDALTGGNLINWDYLGNYKWQPFTCSNASPGVLTCPASNLTNGTSLVVTTKFGGTLPSTGGSWAGILTSANGATDSFTAGVNTTSTGDGSFRQVLQQSIPSGVTASFASTTFTLTSA